MRDRQGLKENKYHAKVNHNPADASPGDELVIKMPQLTPNTVLYRKSLNLTYNFKLNAGRTEADIPDHLTSAIVEKFKMTINGQTIVDTSNYHHMAIYREFWNPKHSYEKELTHRGIQSAATKKKRHAIDGAADDTLASIHGERYSFYLGSFLTDTAFTPQAVRNNVEFHLKLASGEYTLKNICLEYDYIEQPSLASEIKQKYDNHTHIINDYKSHTTKSVAAEESDFEININATYESLRNILVFFKADNNPSTAYVYPKIKDIKVDIDGATNQLFTTEYLAPYSWEDAKKYFELDQSESFMNQESFYTDKYCLVIDLRTINDERSSGIGREIKDYIKLKISKQATSAACKAFVYLVSDKSVSFVNNQIASIEQ
jgi:hypothetical protein